MSPARAADLAQYASRVFGTVSDVRHVDGGDVIVYNDYDDTLRLPGMYREAYWSNGSFVVSASSAVLDADQTVQWLLAALPGVLAGIASTDPKSITLPST